MGTTWDSMGSNGINGIYDAIASGSLTLCELEHGPAEIVDLPTGHGDFPLKKAIEIVDLPS